VSSPKPYIELVADCDSTELGTACGKLFRVGVMSIQDGGDSDIIPAQA
jgi:large subunit ribosomal protein L30e